LLKDKELISHMTGSNFWVRSTLE